MVINETIRTTKIVILLGAPLTHQNFERVGIPYLSKYFEVIVFDCTEWMDRNTENIKCQRAHWHNYLVIKSEMDLALQIEKYRPNYAIDFIGFGNYTLCICQILAKNNVKFIVQKTGSLPTAKISMRIKNILMAFIFKRDNMGILEDSRNSKVISGKTTTIKQVVKLLDKIKLKLQQILILKKLNSLPNYMGLIAGYKSLDRFTSRSNPIIWIGSNDYHTFNKAKKKLMLNRYNQINESFILFIDDALVSASDWTLLGIPPQVTGSLYYPNLNAFFEKIEMMHNMPVKIAGHPNSVTDENYQSKMGGRSVIFGSTAELALQCTIALVHGSTATSFAVLARKPIISLTTQELDRGDYGLLVRTMSQSLGTPLVFIDCYSKRINDLKTLVVDELKYSTYESSYLRNELSNEKEPWGALIGILSTLHK